MPDHIEWSDRYDGYVCKDDHCTDGYCEEWDARLDTFTRCQETMSQKVIDAIRDVCELEPADASNPECLMVTATDLGIILSCHFEGVE